METQRPLFALLCEMRKRQQPNTVGARERTFHAPHARVMRKRAPAHPVASLPHMSVARSRGWFSYAMHPATPASQSDSTTSPLAPPLPRGAHHHRHGSDQVSECSTHLHCICRWCVRVCGFSSLSSRPAPGFPVVNSLAFPPARQRRPRGARPTKSAKQATPKKASALPARTTSMAAP